ncbi:MAG TPA: DUF4221 family protein [Dysgonamonadaceae bacterium]|nr:DUF4221 family protein [Dysgonamonadaceae bacterium]
MNHKLILLSSLIILLSCNNDNTIISNKKSSKNITELDVTSSSIELTEEYLNNYYTQTAFSNDGNDYMVAYNHKTHHIDLFNLTTKEKHTIQLHAEGQSAIPQRVDALYANTPNTIWIYAMGSVYLLNNEGEIDKKYNLPVDEGEHIINNANYSNATIKLDYNAESNTLRYVTVDMSDKSYFYISEFDLETETVKKTELPYTEAEQGIGEKFGWMQHPNVTYRNNRVIYNFPFNSNVYTLNLDTQEMDSFGGKSKFTKNTTSETDLASMDNWFRHTIENVHFYEVNYDTHKDCYYRLHSEGVDFNSNVEMGELLKNKRLYLTIFDGDLNVINEFEFAKDKYPLSGGDVLLGGLFLINDSSGKEAEQYELLEYDVIGGR